LFPPEDQKRIKLAVEETETVVSGEIVPFVVDRSDEYEEAEWRAGAAASALVLCTLTLLHELFQGWVPSVAVGMVLPSVVAFIAGMATARFVPAVRRWFAGRRTMRRRVETRAAAAFLREEVFNTRERTGILLFISLLEHEVLVLADSGINARVKGGAWNGIVGTITDGIRRGRPADGIVEAIRQCRALLLDAGFRARADDRDELSDDLRVDTR
jgi:putative membrane protein